MKMFIVSVMVAVVSICCISVDAEGASVKVAVVTGGHAFDKEAFPALFENQKGIEYVIEEQKDHSELFEDISDWDYDVIVFYSMTQEISEKRRKNFLELLDRGVGIVALHHVMAAFESWPEFGAIIGTKYTLKPKVKDKKNYPGSTFKHGVDFTVHIENPDHPVTKGVKDFKIHDETYKQCVFSENNDVLLTTDDPTSDTTIGWARTYRKARICTIQPGHGPQIFSDPNYRKLVRQAILWTADRPE